MEIFSDEIAKLKGMVNEWKTAPENAPVELEATFGSKGIVDIQTFLRVASHLSAKGYQAIPQKDRLTISLPDNVRFTLDDSQIAPYCRVNSLKDRDYIVIMKDRNVEEANLELKEYDVRVKARREILLSSEDDRVVAHLANWDAQPKYFRLIRRWTFKGKGIKFELSMVRSTQPTKDGRRTVKTFQDQDIMSSIPVYEIECELTNEGMPEDADSFKIMYQGIGEVLRGIQGSPVLIRNTVKRRVLEYYEDLTRTKKFRGVKPVTLEIENMSPSIQSNVANIRANYNVTDKADGLRVLGITDDEGELFMIDMQFNVYKTGLKNPACKKALLDGEYVTELKKLKQPEYSTEEELVPIRGKPTQDLLFFDIYYDKNGVDVSQKPFYNEETRDDRYKAMTSWLTSFNDGIVKSAGSKFSLAVKTFHFAKKDSTTDIFAKANLMLTTVKIQCPYNTDGLIFTPNALPLPGPDDTFFEQFKWKPASDNTIDFFVSFEKDIDTRQDKIINGLDEKPYKILRLYVGTRENPALKDPRSFILNTENLTTGINLEGKGQTKPTLFNPVKISDTMASICYLHTELDMETGEEYCKTERGEPIRSNSIVEMRYDITRPPGWRWIPLRIRADKTEKLLKGSFDRTLNAEKTAENIWNSIHEPVTEFMITTGSEVPSAEELAEFTMPKSTVRRVYYERKATNADIKKVKGLRNFHNIGIKEDILYGAIPKGSSLIDLAVGEGGDIGRWLRANLQFVLAMDATGSNITNPKSGAYSRLLNQIMDMKPRGRPIPNFFFVVGDSTLNLADGSAGLTEEDKNMLRSIIGYTDPHGPIPYLVSQQGAKKLQGGADCISCMYALHYFFDAKEKFDGFLRNVDQNLKKGGFFIGTNFDGQKVFDALRNKKIGESIVGQEEDSILWEIRKQYEEDGLAIAGDEVFGKRIDVKFITIGTEQSEWLVPWEFLVEKMKSIGCKLVKSELYDTTYSKGSLSKKYPMNNASKQYSFFHRWYIFQREEDAKKPLEVVAEVMEAKPLAAQLSQQVQELQEPVVEEVKEVQTAEEDYMTSLTDATRAVLAKEKYEQVDIFTFYEESGETTRNISLPKGFEKFPARYVSPNGKFPIMDTTETPAAIYPSITHFLAGMKFKLASAKPELAKRFTQSGAIHTEAEAKLVRERATKGQVSLDFENNTLLDETKAVLTEAEKLLKDAGTKFDESKWISVKDKVLRDAIAQRLRGDKRFCNIMNQAKQQGRYFLYSKSWSKDNELGGARSIKTKKIEGENKYGRFIREMMDTMATEVTACMGR